MQSEELHVFAAVFLQPAELMGRFGSAVMVIVDVVQVVWRDAVHPSFVSSSVLTNQDHPTFAHQTLPIYHNKKHQVGMTK